MHKISKIAAIAVVSTVGVAAIYGYTMNVGDESARNIASKYNLCGEVDCSDGKRFIFAAVADAGKVSPRMAQWCLGTDGIAGVRVHVGGLIKTGLVWAMRLPCGDLLKDDDIKPVNKADKQAN